MRSRTRVAFSRKLALSLLAPAILAGSVIAPMNADAFLQQDLRLASDGTVYQYICNNNTAAQDHLRVTNLSMSIGFNSPANLGGDLQQGDPLIASNPANPLVALARAKRLNAIVTPASCPPSITFEASAGVGGIEGTWTLGGTVVTGFNDGDLEAITDGTPIPIAQITNSAGCGNSVYGFGGPATCSVASPFSQPADGFNLTSNQGILLVYDGKQFITPNTAGSYSVAGGAGGFDSNAANVLQTATRDQDSDGFTVTTTTTTTTTTTSTTTTTTHIVPTVGNWGMMVLGLAFLGAIAWMLKARKVHA